MEENNQIISDDKKEEEECKNEENKLLLENNKNDNINDNKNEKINDTEEKEFKIGEPFLNDNAKNWNNGPINNINNNIENNNNLVIGDYLITIQYTKMFHIPYFIFGNIFNFYCPCKKFKSPVINLSQIPTPPFGVVLTDCK